jgi:hypothetical protein
MVPVAGSVVLASLVAGHPAVAELTGGGIILFVAVIMAVGLARRAALEPDPGRHLVLDVMLVAVVFLALIGVAVMGLAIPAPS